ncbi:hypothetical protein BABINDRAFT_174070 [Babjeviella inositovora NRRL Y-12698]|uniref:Topoisomerase I damage affected protein 2 n=1 Tax=Babjeviella inositovora NRRL Y-12698 TaxID=984486 RepID=A0A1E3QUT8_9ASCO|nr:uncharacterized protein BABINDRAFT_174070 [Babjeviella inositovora NRRL Y-12698]ODQ81418.1 hypothetical protein BABINDRAFT_174070 [Babjeviella inositovora NRRL Y-12698]
MSDTTIIYKEPVLHAPLSESNLASIITDAVQEDFAAHTTIQRVLEHLQAKSSLHKFLVTVSVVETAGANAAVKTSFGAAWDESKDGTYTQKVELAEAVAIVTVNWIYVGN